MRCNLAKDRPSYWANVTILTLCNVSPDVTQQSHLLDSGSRIPTATSSFGSKSWSATRTWSMPSLVLPNLASASLSC